MKPWARRALVVSALLAAHAGLAAWCDRVGLIERLLSPAGDGLAAAVVAAVALYAVRLVLVWAVPGWLLAQAVLGLWAHGSRRTRRS